VNKTTRIFLTTFVAVFFAASAQATSMRSAKKNQRQVICHEEGLHYDKTLWIYYQLDDSTSRSLVTGTYDYWLQITNHYPTEVGDSGSITGSIEISQNGINAEFDFLMFGNSPQHVSLIDSVGQWTSENGRIESLNCHQ